MDQAQNLIEMDHMRVATGGSGLNHGMGFGFDSHHISSGQIDSMSMARGAGKHEGYRSTGLDLNLGDEDGMRGSMIGFHRSRNISRAGFGTGSGITITACDMNRYS